MCCKDLFTRNIVFLPHEGEGGHSPDEGESKTTVFLINSMRYPLTPVCTHTRPSPSRARGTTCGFTLIELLVVVLIIGILAAVALPQYQKAVRKAHGAEALTAVDALNQAVTAYYLEHDTYNAISKETLHLQLPELQHFRYAVGSIGRYENGNAQLQDTFFKYDSGASNGRSLSLNLANPDVAVYMLWQDGKLRVRCFATGINSCGDYFNCNATPRSPLVPGSTLYTGGDCYLTK